MVQPEVLERVEGAMTTIAGESAVSKRIVVAVLTYARTVELNDVIPCLLDACAGMPSASVLVVDNNPSGDAEATVRTLGHTVRAGALRYTHESTPGIAAARNRALAEASNADLLVFIDDDERPGINWLEHLVHLYEKQPSAAIVGPVVSEFESTPDEWIVAGQFFERRRMPTGSRVSVAATNNLLLDLHQIRAFDIWFDDRFGLTGGSDTLFSRELVRRGGNILWCDEAIVVDKVPNSRLTRAWVLQKALRFGNVMVRVDMITAGSPLARILIRAKYFIGGLGRIGLGGSRACLGVAVRSMAHQARGARLVARGSGMLLASVGVRYAEYARVGARKRRIPLSFGN